jgi:hypothetical protein
MSLLDSPGGVFNTSARVHACKKNDNVRRRRRNCEILRFSQAVNMKITVFWNVALCTLVEIYQRFDPEARMSRSFRKVNTFLSSHPRRQKCLQKLFCHGFCSPHSINVSITANISLLNFIWLDVSTRKIPNTESK